MSRPHFAQDPLDPLLTTREAALRLGVSLRTVKNYVARAMVHCCEMMP